MYTTERNKVIATAQLVDMAEIELTTVYGSSGFLCYSINVKEGPLHNWEPQARTVHPPGKSERATRKAFKHALAMFRVMASSDRIETAYKAADGIKSYIDELQKIGREEQVWIAAYH